MLKNYLTVAWRNLKRNKVFTLINIVGLAIGISASLVIYLLVYYDFSFDKQHKDVKRMYRVVSSLHFPGTLIRNGGISFPTPAAFKKEVTGIEASAQFQNYYVTKVSIPSESGNGEERAFKNERHIIFANADFFNLFEQEWISGSPQTSLNEPFQVVLTEDKARKYFPGTDFNNIIGRTIYYNDSVKVSVTGIVKRPSQTTDFNFAEFISHSTILNSNIKNNMGWDQWGSVNSDCQFYVKLNKGVDPKNIEKQLVALRTKYAKDQDYMKTENLLQPLGDLHFMGQYDFFAERRAHKPTLYGLLAVAGFLLILACINFINLTTAQSSSRAKEIGIRKTMGGSKKNLIFQFLGETFLLTTIATIISILIAPIILKIFSDFMPQELRFNLLEHPQIVIFSVLLILGVTLLAGFYPAAVLTRFQPVAVLKNQFHSTTAGTRKAVLRKVLTVSQFVIAQFFVIATIAISKQIKFALNKDMGFRKDAIVNMHSPWFVRSPEKKTTFLNKLRSYPEIASASLGGAPPAADGYSSTTMKYKDGKTELESTVEIKYADSAYFKMYQIPLIAGRYSRVSDSLTREFLINESYAKFLGFKTPNEALGKIIDRGEERYIIVGVIRDFNMKSIHSNITPLVYINTPDNFGTYHILLNPNNPEAETWKSAIAKMEKGWKEVYPENDFEYKFLDERIASFYKKEQNISKLLGWATGLAILISCLGLLGLVMYTTVQRTKEIGVRKVLGASVTQLVALLSKDLLLLVLLAFVLAVPLAWLALSNWLQDFVYRTSLSVWIFALGGGFMIFVALLTLSIQTIRAAMQNPVGALRSE